MTDQALPKTHRLLRPAEFKRVFDSAEASRVRLFTVLARENSLQHSRLGLVVSRRVNKRAVVRNAIKRVVRESFRCAPIRDGGLDIVVIARPAASAVSNRQRREALRRAIAHFV